MENVDHLPEVIIEIYDITAPESGYFVFWTNQKERMNVNVKPFILKEPRDLSPSFIQISTILKATRYCIFRILVQISSHLISGLKNRPGKMQ